MPKREREWARFARMLLPEMRTEKQLLEWLRDENIDAVLAFLEVWNKHQNEELDEFMSALGTQARFFTRRGGTTPAGRREFERVSLHDQERMAEVQRQIRERYRDIEHVDYLIRYAHLSAAGTLKIEEADRIYAAIMNRDAQ